MHPPTRRCTWVSGPTQLYSPPEQPSSSHNLPSGRPALNHLSKNRPPPRSLPVHLFAVLVTVVLHSALSPVLATFHLPVFTLPFVLTSWVFLLFPTGNDTVTRTLETLTPEQRIFRARKLSKQLTSSRDGATITKENLLSVAEQGEA